VTLDTLPGASIDSVNSQLTVFLNAGGFWNLAKTTFSLSFSYFNLGLASEFKGSNFNILVFGPVGSGKSSWIQTCLTMLHKGNNILKNVCGIGGSSGHVTTTLRKIPLPDGLGGISDTWGLALDTYRRDELSFIVKGRLPSKWDMKDDFAKLTTEIEQTAENRQTESVIVLVPVGTVVDPKELKNLREQIPKLVSQHLNPVILLAFADTIDKSIRGNPNRPSKKIKDLMVQVAQALSIPLMMVFPCVPYSVESSRSFEIERLTYIILHSALCNARDKREFDKQHGVPSPQLSQGQEEKKAQEEKKHEAN